VNTSSPRRRALPAPLQHPVWRFSILVGLDALISAASMLLALALRFDDAVGQPYWHALPFYLGLLLTCRVVTNVSCGVHRWSFSLANLQDAMRVIAATGLGSAAFVVLVYLLRVLSPPRSVIVMEMLITGAAMLGLRFTPRIVWVYWTRLKRFRRGDVRRTLIVGAGASGEMLFRDLQRSGEHDYHVVGFIDDNKSKWNNLVSGRPVLGGLAALPAVIEKHRISNILIAIPRDSQHIIREVVTLCAGLRINIKALPVSFLYFQDRGAASMLHDLAPEDLLSRRRVTFAPHERSAFAGRRVLVTGAAGSIGSEICRQLLSVGVGHLVAVDMNENGLYLLEQRFKRELPAASFVTQLADIRDPGRISALFQQWRPQDVFHAAAHKHVPLMEAAPCEAVKNNVLGTRNVLHAAERASVECLVFISTDKAVAPSSVMGATKRVGEIMTRAVAHRSDVRGCIVRFGNVLGSDGSVVPLFKQQIEAGGPLTITHPDVSRYFMTIPEAVSLVLKSAYGRYGELCVLNMGEPIRILDLAHQMIAMAGLVPDKDIKIAITGLRPGEKLNEELVTEDEEVALRADGKIQVISGPPPPASLWDVVAQLEDAASHEDAERALRLLQVLVPTYRRNSLPVPAVAS
jgi:FlaA1/EpsC-like NDP-sugar epimerase